MPFTPGGAGVQQAFLVKVFAGTAAGATVAAYSVGQQIAIASFTLGIGFVALVTIFQFRSFKDVIAAGRADREGGGDGRRRRALLQPLARLAHERDGLGEDGRHHGADLLGLLGRGALDVDARDRRDGHVDRELDRVVGPRQALLALQLLGELRHAPLELVGISEQAAETFHATILAMAPSVEGAGVALNVVERGAGTPVLLIHGLASDAEAMAPVAQALAAEARVIAYDRRGYGSSGAPEPYRGTTVEEQAQDAAALLGALDAGPAVVCGDGFGALVALDLVKRHGALVRAAVLSNPPLFMFVPEATERLGAQHAELEAAVREGGRRPASRRGSAAAWRAGRSSAPAPRTGRSSPTTPAWRAGRSRAASCARWTCPPSCSPARGRRRTSWPRPTRWPRCCPPPARADDGDLVAATRACSRHPERGGALGVREGLPPAHRPARCAARAACGRLRGPAPNAPCAAIVAPGRPIELPVQVAPGLTVRVRDPYGGVIARNRLFVAFSVRYASRADRARVASVTWTLDGARRAATRAGAISCWRRRRCTRPAGTSSACASRPWAAARRSRRSFR